MVAGQRRQPGLLVAVAFAATLFLGLAAVAATLLWTAEQADRDAVASTRKLAALYTEKLKNSADDVVKDYSFWNEAWEALVDTLDGTWFRTNIIEGFAVRRDLVHVVRPDDGISFTRGLSAEEPPPNPFDFFGDAFRALVSEARAANRDNGEPRVVGAWLLGRDGSLHYAATSAILPFDAEKRPPPGTPISLMVLFRRLDTAQLGREIDVSPGPVTPETPAHGFHLPLAGPSVGPTLHLTWTQTLPSSLMVRRAAPILLPVSLVTVLVAVGFVFALTRDRQYALERQEELEQIQAELHAQNAELERHRSTLGDLVAARTSELTRTVEELAAAKSAAEAALQDLATTQASLVRVRTNASLTQLSAAMAHRMNTPLGVTITSASLLGGSVEEVRESIEKGEFKRSDLMAFLANTESAARLIQSNAERAARAVESIQALVQADGSLQVADVSPAMVLAEVASPLRPAFQAAGHVLTVRGDGEDPEREILRTNPVVLNAVLTALLRNTLDHAFPDGRGGAVELSFESDVDGVTFIVADDGVGIDDDLRPRLFDPFVSTGGVTHFGLGLSVVDRLVGTALSGRVEFSAGDGRGTAVRVFVPRQPANGRSAEADTAQSKAAQSKAARSEAAPPEATRPEATPSRATRPSAA